jgi:hypothetical protein
MLGEFAKTKNTVLVYFRVYGLINSNNLEKIDYYKKIYKSILPPDLYTVLINNEQCFVEFEDLEKAIDFCDDNFPSSTKEGELEAYIHFKVFNNIGQIVSQN